MTISSTYIVQKHHKTYIFMSSKILLLLFSASKYVFSLFSFEYLLLFKTLSNQMFNLSIDDPLTMKLIVQVTLAVIYGIFFNLIVPTNLVLQPSPVKNTQINRLLFTGERTRKVISVANCITSECLILVSTCLKKS